MQMAAKEKLSSIFSRNSEANALEYLENMKKRFLLIAYNYFLCYE